jgi:hypothetical protein
MKYGAYYNCRDHEIIWFRTSLPLEAGFYHLHTHSEESPDVCIAESVPELIMKASPWIHEEEAAFQNQVKSPGENAEEQRQISEKMTDELVQRLGSNDDTAWVDEPRWVKHLHMT